MFIKLARHSWQMLRRSAFFEKSMFIKGLMAFFVMFLFMQLYSMGRILPMLLHENFPERSPGGWVYGFFLLYMVADLFMRLFIQPMPARHIQPYMHLPVKRKSLATYWIFRSWLHPVNLYLLVFFHSFVQVTINPQTSSQALGLLGVLLLTGINQGLIMMVKSPAKGIGPGTWVVVILAGAITLGYSLHHDWMMELSLSMFLGFVNGNLQVFGAVIVLLAGTHLWVFSQVKTNFYSVYDQGRNTAAMTGASRWEKYLASFPVYGTYWLLEWRLVTRNKRCRFHFFSMIPMAVLFIVAIASFSKGDLVTYMVILFMMAAGYGGFHLQNALGWESHFFDLLSSRHFSIRDFLKAKFYFYFAYALLQFLIVAPLLAWLSMPMLVLFFGMFLYATGFSFLVYMRMGISNSTRFDANGKSSFNMEGVSGMKFLQILLLYLSIVPFIILGNMLPFTHGIALLMGSAGMLFLLFHDRWIGILAKKFNNQKHKNLALYRQK